MHIDFFRFTILFVAIFFGGWLGLEMKVPPGYASPLWPPTGIALAGLLVWGRRFWPALLLGAIGNEVIATSQLEDGLTPRNLLSVGLISLGFTLQAITAYRLSEKFLGGGVPRLDSPKQTVTFFLLTGPLACIIASSIGVCSIVAVGIIPLSQAANAWLNWWIGDSMGVSIVAPLFFCLSVRQDPLWRARRLTVGVPLMAALLALALIFMQVYSAEKSRIQMAFDSQALTMDRLVIGYTDKAIIGARSLADLFQASEVVSREEFGVFARSHLERHPEIQAFEWLPRVSRGELRRFEASVRSEGYPRFEVSERDMAGSLRPVGVRDEYFPIDYIEPMSGNEKAFGYDSADNPYSLASKQQAMASGEARATQQLTMIQGDGRENAVLLSLPVFDKPATATPKLHGFISAVILPGRLVEMALQDMKLHSFAIRLEDLTASPNAVELYNKSLPMQLNSSYGLIPWRNQFQFCGRIWRLTITPDNSFLGRNGSELPWLTLVGGLFFSSLLGIMLLTTSGRAAVVESLIEKRTAELKAAEKHVRESETHLRTLVDSQPECIKLLDRQGRLMEMNRAGLNILEAESPQQLLGSEFIRLVRPKFRPAFADMLERVFKGQAVNVVFEANTLKGRHCWLETHSVPMRDSEGEIVALLGLTRDITERKHADDNLKLAARVFGEAHEGILITNANGEIIDVNPTFSDITGYGREEVLGKSPNILQSGKHNDEFYRDMWRDLINNRHWKGEVWNRKKNGEFFAELLTISALLDEDGQIIYYVGLFSDITQSKHQQQMLELLAHYDPLTGLPNRTLFSDRMLQAIARGKRDNTLLAICFLDLDGFKPVNDQFGHSAGDQVLIEVAKRIKNTLREEDTVSRHGGDEFAVLMSKLQSQEQCEQAILRIHQAINEPITLNDKQVKIGVSTGITIFPLDPSDPDTLLRHADQAMYQAKLAGKDRYYLFDASQDQQILQRYQQARDIESALVGGQFCLYYQPKVNLKSGKVSGVEALIRWLHPERGIIDPHEFLHIVCNSELEIQLGNWVISEAWRQLGGWRAIGLHLEVSINISAFHLLWNGFFATLESVLATAPEIPSHFLQLEILESTALDDLMSVNRVISACRNGLGVKTALDDFGTGYSSLNHLRHLPIDIVKIDQTFVRDMLDDPDDSAIVESVISLSHAFSREVVAEGVESMEQGAVLVLMGCYLAQGFVISKPLPGSGVAGWIENYLPCPDWIRYANAEYNPEQIMVAICRIDAGHWLARMSASLETPSDSKLPWPGIEVKHSHFGRWLKQAQFHQQYNREWLSRIGGMHADMFALGKVLMQLHLDGHMEAALAGLEELRRLRQKLDQCLAEFA